ncbi:DHHC zinc finger domain containing protein [Tritrichomonas foetus]|uniref:Palmitoyltransferase n=1 Tax=Tritrichomonas foetus TaxID=1144522 RepID=A0A1J4KM66_9EUKA|nr:DHHC zinc finger domain containing protein [Tritrichomonas foetus]|eukprot:OHT12393.1 DHHC zinc finger domain containing protein [Tritrichomonas foetus]
MIDQEDASFDQSNELESQLPLPPLTQWENLFSFAGLQINYVPATGEYYLNHWHIHYGFPFAVEFVIISSYLVAILVHQPNVSFYSSAFVFFLTVFMLLFAYSYVVTILVGPGYIPFYYPMKISQGPTRPDYLSGMVTREDQLEYAKSQKIPNRTRFFNSAHRFVIRPDHLCAWVTSFIGKKNHKLFFLFNFWGVIYISLFVYSCFRTLYETIFSICAERAFFFAICIIYTALGISFLLLTGSFLKQNISQISQNRTQFEIMKQMPPMLHRQYPWYRNWEEVFGSVSEWYLWLIPIPAFRGIDDYALSTFKYPSEKCL